MVIDEHIRIQGMKDFRKRKRIFRIHFDEIAVQVEIAGASTETVFLWSILVRTTRRRTVHHSPDIVGWNKRNHW